MIAAISFAGYDKDNGDKDPGKDPRGKELVKVSGVSLNKSTLTLTEGGSKTLTATVAPDNATEKTVTWKRDKTSIATVDAAGKVTAVAKGITIITATTNDGDKAATCTITVNEPRTMAMTTAISEVSIYMEGSGTAVINWDDSRTYGASETVRIYDTSTLYRQHYYLNSHP